MIPGRSCGEENGNPLQYSCLENSMDRRAWRTAVHGVTKSWTRLSDYHIHTYTPMTLSTHFNIAYFTILNCYRQSCPGYFPFYNSILYIHFEYTFCRPSFKKLMTYLCPTSFGTLIVTHLLIFHHLT